MKNLFLIPLEFCLDSLIKKHLRTTSMLFFFASILFTNGIFGQMSSVTPLNGGSALGISQATVTIGNVEVVTPANPYLDPFGIVRTGCETTIPLSIEICNVEEAGTITLDIDNTQWMIQDLGDFTAVSPSSPFVTSYEVAVEPTSTDPITGVEECVTKTIIIANIPGTFTLFPEVKTYTDLVFNSPSNIHVNLEIPKVHVLQSNPIGEDGESILLSDIDDASISFDPLECENT